MREPMAHVVLTEDYFDNIYDTLKRLQFSKQSQIENEIYVLMCEHTSALKWLRLHLRQVKTK